MKIAIAERLHPFSHHMGTQFLIPHTPWAVQVFPTRLNFTNLEDSKSFFLSFDFQGPIKEFTAELNLEQNLLSVFGNTQHGFMRYQLFCKEDGIYLAMEKTPLEKVVMTRSSETIVLSKGESKLVCPFARKGLQCEERLSLGMHKAQDWDLIRRRLDCKEIFPHWLRLSHITPSTHTVLESGNFSLLHACKKKIEQGDKVGVLGAFENLFLAAFEGVLVPRLTDSDYQGIVSEESAKDGSPLPLLVESGKLIRSLFIQEKEGVISLLPCLPTPFHCGRMVSIKTSSGAILNMEWSKKALKKVVIDSAASCEMHLQLPKGIRSFRIIRGKAGKEVIDIDAKGRASFSLDAGKTIQLDRFLA